MSTVNRYRELTVWQKSIKFVAEGFGRRLPKEFIRFLRISISSLFKLQTQLEICKSINLTDPNIFNHFYEVSH